MFKINLRAFIVGCILGIISASVMIGFLMLVGVKDIYIIKNNVISPYFAGIFIVIVNVWATIDTPTKNYQEFKEAGFEEIRRDHKNMLAFYPYFSALVALISTLSAIVKMGDMHNPSLAVIIATVLIIMTVGIALACSFGIIMEAEKREKDSLHYYLEGLKAKV